MILTLLRMRNFRQFRGEEEIRFSTERERNVTVVTGANGSGKTGLFLALNWALYGTGVDNAGPLLSKGVKTVDDAFVEVHFRHEGIQYVARRDIPVPGKRLSSELALQELRAGGRSRSVPNPDQRLNEILPSDARRYFFFDGERIDDMSKPGHEEQVRDALWSVLKLRVLERTIQHLTSVEKEFAHDIRETMAEDEAAAELVAEMESIRETVAGLKTEREAKQAELDACERRLGDVEETLRSLDGIREIMLAEAKLDAQLAASEERLAHLSEDLFQRAGRAGPSLAADALDIASQIVDEKRRRGEIPSNIRQQLIDDLLREGTCICDRHLDAAARKALMRRRDGAVSDEMEDVVLQIAGQLAGLRDLARSLPGSLADALTGFEATTERMEELQREKEGLRDRIAAELRDRTAEGVTEEARSLDAARRQLETSRGDLKFSLGRLDNQLQQLEREFAQKTDLLRRTQARSGTATREKRRYELAAEARVAAEDLLQRFATDMRDRIQAETDRVFKSLVWKTKQFEGVRILDDYRIDVIDRFGASALRGLSAGERQVLSLAFIVAMSQVTGEEAPLVIDTPFGRISETPLHNIAESLPDISGQLILLVTDRELDESARKYMARRIGREYSLAFDDEIGATRVIEGDNAG